MADQDSSKPLRPIIIKKVIAGGHGAHGGAWKVAYADFVTAMMAFFLLLWLLNATTEEQKSGIADYFSPTISITSRGSGASGMLKGGDQVKAEDNNLVTEEPTKDMEGGIPSVKEEAVQTDDTPDSKAGATDYTDHTGDPEQGKVEADGSEVQSGAGQSPAEAAAQALYNAEQAKLESAQGAIEAAVQSAPELDSLEKSLKVEMTDEGLKIQILDQEGYSMFESGSAVMNKQSKELLKMVAVIVKDLPNQLMLSGHTDSKPMKGRDNYDNWDLSTDRANSSRRILVEAGVTTDRFAIVSGKADRDPMDADNPTAASNRRISIVLKRQVALPAHTAPPEQPVHPLQPPIQPKK